MAVRTVLLTLLLGCTTSLAGTTKEDGIDILVAYWSKAPVGEVGGTLTVRASIKGAVPEVNVDNGIPNLIRELIRDQPACSDLEVHLEWSDGNEGRKVCKGHRSGDTITAYCDPASPPPRFSIASTPQPTKRPQPPASMEVMDPTVIQGFCAGEWPADFAMQRYCQKQQREAFTTLERRWPLYDVPSAVEQTIRRGCIVQWGIDFAMRNYCERQQLEAYRAISANR